MEHLHTSRRLYLGPTPACVQTLLDDLWQLRDSEEVGLLKLLSTQLLWKVEHQPLETSPTVRYFTSSQVSIARETRNNPVRRPEPEPHGAGVGGSVPGGRNQSQELLPRCVWRKPLHIFAGGEDAPGSRIAAEQ